MSNGTSVELCRAHRDELALFMGWESEAESQRFVGQNSLEEHQSQFDSEQYVYLKILSDKRPAGFILLVLSPDGRSVDFRRIVVCEKNGGIGQKAIVLLEAYFHLTGGFKRSFQLFEITGCKMPEDGLATVK